jgi:hypothetical protein
LLLESAGNLGVGVGLAGAGSDASTSQPIVGGQILEQRDGGVEEIDKLIFLFVVAVAVRVQGGVTSSVLAPFVLPVLRVSKWFWNQIVEGSHQKDSSSPW